MFWHFMLIVFSRKFLMKTICMKCQILFSGKEKKKNIINLSSVELAQIMVMVKEPQLILTHQGSNRYVIFPLT